MLSAAPTASSSILGSDKRCLETAQNTLRTEVARAQFVQRESKREKSEKEVEMNK